MTNLMTQAQTEALARKVGFVPYNARIMAAICLCEAPPQNSTERLVDFDRIGDQDLANDVWGYSYGGAQIRSLRAERGTGKWRDQDRLLDPEFNLRAARYIKIAADSFRPWSTYTSGMYKAYLQEPSEDGIGPVFPAPVGTYVVVGGDTLSRIATRLPGSWTWQDLARVNNLHSPYLITIGQTLILPTEPIGA